MSNRRARKAEASGSATDDSILLRRPSQRKSQPSASLYQIAANRQAGISADAAEGTNLKPDIISYDDTVDGNGSDVASDAKGFQDESTERLATFLLYAISLTMVHFTFDVFVHQQYRQEIGWDMISKKTAIAFPILFLLVYICHSRASLLWMQIVFLLGGISAGCYIVHSSNQYSYYAVMQRTPPLGTLWIWCVLELEAVYAAISVAAVAVFFIWGGYTVY